MGISSKVVRKLWASSAGYCANPNCTAELFPFFESGEITNIGELAHMIAQKEEGPRGGNSLTLSQRDEFNNIVLLCPTCHTTIDKNPELFPIETIRDWKNNHENKIRALFQIPKFDNREKARKIVTPILSENSTIFHNYGPFSENAAKDQHATELMWGRLSMQKILPNNRILERIVENNLELLTEEEIELFNKFKIHREGFEYNKISGDVNSTVLRFPSGFENVFK